MVRAGNWTTSQGTAVIDEGALHLKLDELQEDARHDTLVPFPNADCEYSTVFVSDLAPAGIKKKLRTEGPSNTGPKNTDYTAQAGGARQDQRPNADLVRDFMDAKVGKTTRDVPNGDGLRIPASFPTTLTVAYPPVWVSRKSPDGDNSALVAEYRQAWETLKTHCGASFGKLALQDDYQIALDNAVDTLYAPAPASKEKWRTLFFNSFRLLTLFTTVTLGAKAAEKVATKLKDGWNSNLVDVEEALRAGEKDEGSKNADPNPMDTRTQNAGIANQIAALQRELQQVKLENSVLRQQQATPHAQSFRGSDRGRGRGGRKF